MTSQTVERDFEFSFKSKGFHSKLTAPVPIPLNVSVSDLVGRLVNAHNLPCYVEKDLQDSLEEFVAKETTKYHDDQATNLIKKLQDGEVDIGQMAEKWNKAFTQEHKAFATEKGPNNEVAFGEVYHKLIHSNALETLLNLEHSYAVAVDGIISQRDLALDHLQKRQGDEMESAVQAVGLTYTDDQVNLLAARHFEDIQMLEAKWASELSSLQESQRVEFREWVSTVHEDLVSSPDGQSSVLMQRIRAMSDAGSERRVEEDQTQLSRLEESFTIHLGAQMKTMHNLRLMAVDVMDLCRHKTHKVGSTILPSPQRLQTAMSLYSNSLCGLVLLVDDRINSYTGIKREFAGVCQQSTDFHFPDLDTQLRVIQQHVLEANQNRPENTEDEYGNGNGNSRNGDKQELNKDAGNEKGVKKQISQNLQAGDFYLTRHSNLAEVHVVFHLVVDDNIRSSEITSRHPTIIGLRNILKCSSQHDILTITIPLFLVYEMTEEMTINWCIKRAELVLKCVKGFMMEMTTWGGNESRTIQFVVPKGISEDLFVQLSAMLPSIFRILTSIKT
ncbi:LOW QUALITY PROTEIN: FERRY endosomal RAB5 effector complex subunit 3-like [Ptychodera flava]|uniref:LOW QUALITY PROTEIN: FERRY endosomal RAB5 effector complex subunit 3-like n=1 Tax=Ptychodera flava TaxID=63121 RepID=UPI00396A0B94